MAHLDWFPRRPLPRVSRKELLFPPNLKLNTRVPFPLPQINHPSHPLPLGSIQTSPPARHLVRPDRSRAQNEKALQLVQPPPRVLRPARRSARLVPQWRWR